MADTLFRAEVKVVLYVLAECKSVAETIAHNEFRGESERVVTVEPATIEGLRRDGWAHTRPYARTHASEPCYRYVKVT
jgi:hypothetical protein